MVKAPITLLAGCLECSGSTPIWRGNAAFIQSHRHGEATGHNVWTREVTRADSKSAVLAAAPTPAPPPPSLTPPLSGQRNPRLSREAMCAGKVKHRSAPAAQKAIDNCTFDTSFLNVYRCFYCGKWHVGHLIKPWRANKLAPE